MNSLKLVLILIFSMAALERFLNTFWRKEKKGDVKYTLLTYVILFTYFTSIIIALSDFLLQKNNPNLCVTFLGFLFAFLGIILRRSSIKALADNWSMHIKLIPEQRLVKDGPYKKLRHPYYLAVMFELIGVALYFNSALSLFFAIAVQLPLLLIRVKIEEGILISQFGEKYIDYRKGARWIF